MNTTQTGYTESDTKVQSRMDRRAWLNQIALADFWAREHMIATEPTEADAVYLQRALIAAEGCDGTPAQIVEGVSSPEWFAEQPEVKP